MDLLVNIFILTIVYLFINTDIFFEYILKKLDGTVDYNNNITNKGEIIKYIIIIMTFILIELYR